MLYIPEKFLNTRYNSGINPENPPKDFTNFQDGANCLIFTYAILQHFGLQPPIFWPIELWNDTDFTKQVFEFQMKDILFYGNSKNDLYWAHLGLYLGDNKVIHLSKENTIPEICDVGDLTSRKSYTLLIGAKRLLPKN